MFICAGSLLPRSTREPTKLQCVGANQVEPCWADSFHGAALSSDLRPVIWATRDTFWKWTKCFPRSRFACLGPSGPIQKWLLDFLYCAYSAEAQLWWRWWTHVQDVIINMAFSWQARHASRRWQIWSFYFRIFFKQCQRLKMFLLKLDTTWQINCETKIWFSHAPLVQLRMLIIKTTTFKRECIF